MIQKDLSEFYDTTLEDVYTAVVNDVMTVWGEEHRTWLQFKEDVYFNSGMMLLNLNKMREDSLPEKLLDYRLNGINYFMDQDALNVVFEGKIRLVSPEYNLLNCFLNGIVSRRCEIFTTLILPDAGKWFIKMHTYCISGIVENLG